MAKVIESTEQSNAHLHGQPDTLHQQHEQPADIVYPESNSSLWNNLRSEWIGIIVKLNHYAVLFVSCLIDAMFIVVWVGLQFGVQLILSTLELHGIDQVALTLGQVALLVVTGILLGTYLYEEIIKAIIYVRWRIAEVKAQHVIHRD